MALRITQFSPLPLPTGRSPSDASDIAWRKNEVFLDINQYNTGTAATLIWFNVILYLSLALALKNLTPNVVPWLLITSLAITLATLPIFYKGLKKPTPLPVRFNRQRREICVMRAQDVYWIIPWESVIATAHYTSETARRSGMSLGFLNVRFDSPHPRERVEKDCHELTFNCPDEEMAASYWEYIRTYMESGPDAVHEPSRKFTRTKGIFASYLDDLKEAAKRKGWILTLIWDGFFGLVFFNVLLADYLERKKLYPLPDLDHPDIIEWSKPLPPEQWARPSAEFQVALAEYEARRVS
ncbi:DUF6708 domain-containing protein [Pseudomonas sp. 21LCFQ010]|uniref:DUF6708 domain-containing protein n=1 Tax=Pseudomonas sp. 21LCFQ010 TaxID=2957506 RepID=UPI0034573A8E